MSASDLSVPQALTLFYLLGGGLLLLSLVKTVLDVAAFFRRTPPIDHTIATLVRELNAQLQEKVSTRDCASTEQRHMQQIRDVETRAKDMEARLGAELRAMESRIDNRLSELHASVSALRATMVSAISDVMKDLGFVQGAAHSASPSKGR
ncbi:hypothetical protein [Thermosphaera sp.]